MAEWDGLLYIEYSYINATHKADTLDALQSW
jgi:hypothetical protein